MESDLSKNSSNFLTVNAFSLAHPNRFAQRLPRLRRGRQYPLRLNQDHYPRINVNKKTIDGIPVQTLLRTFGSPLFVVSHQAITKTYKYFSSTLRKVYPNSVIAYSIKTNNVPGICKILKDQGTLAEVVSSYEYWLANKIGFKDQEVIFNGPNKGRKALESSILSGAKINVDNPDELKWLLSLANSRKKKTRIGIRVNPFGENQSRFGFCIRSGEAEAAIRQISEHQNVQLSGIHFHIGSNVFPPDLYQEATETVCRFILKFKNLLLPNLQYLDIGGGFPVPGSGAFDDADKTYTIGDYLNCIIEPLKIFQLDQLQLIVEPGRYLVDEPIVLLATVISSRMRNSMVGVTVDASMSILPLAQTRTQRVAVIRNAPIHSLPIKTAPRPTTIYGSSCVEIDWLAKQNLTRIYPGEIIVFFNAGAYNISQGTQFNRPRPAVVIIKDGQTTPLRRAERNEDLLRIDV